MIFLWPSGPKKCWQDRETGPLVEKRPTRSLIPCASARPVSVVTHHRSLDAWATEHLLRPRGRWHETFLSFTHAIMYVPRKDNKVANAMSHWVYHASQAWSDISRD